MALALTKRAVQEVHTIMKEQKLDKENVYLRMGVKGSGCSGFGYLLDVVTTKSDNDEEFEFDGIRVICDPKSYIYLNETELDFKDEIMGRGFIFNNKLATNVCGCGQSFSV